MTIIRWRTNAFWIFHSKRTSFYTGQTPPPPPACYIFKDQINHVDALPNVWDMQSRTHFSWVISSHWNLHIHLIYKRYKTFTFIPGNRLHFNFRMVYTESALLTSLSKLNGKYQFQHQSHLIKVNTKYKWR